MLNLDEIKRSIQESCEKLILKIKEIAPFNEFSPIPEEILKERISNLRVEKASIFDNSVDDYKYNGLNNTIIVDKKYLGRPDINLENLYMDMALQVTFYNSELQMSGFGNETLEALNKGFREMLVLNIVGSDRSVEYFESDEYIYTNLFCQLFDVSTLQEAYFKNNPSLILDLLKGKSLEQGVLFKMFNEEANRNMKIRISKKGKSSLGKVQEGMLNFLIMDEPDKGLVSRFLDNMARNSEIFRESNKYDNLNSSNQMLEQIYLDYVQKLSEEKTY